jgi:drug/metabolite transporter (DMT)-like permease
MSPHTRQQLALGAALAVVVIWGANFTLQKYLLQLLSVPGFLWMRYLLMPACALLLMRWQLGQWWPRLPRQDALALAGLGFVGHSLHVGLVTWGVHWSTPFSSAVILAVGPIFTLLLLRGLGRERLVPAQLTGVVLALAGLLMFLSDKLLGGQWRAGGGDLVLVFAAALFSWYTVLAQPLFERHGTVLAMGYATVLGGLPLMLFSMPAGLQAPWGQLGPWDVAGLLWSVVVASFVGWTAWGWVNTVRGVARTVPLQYLIPPIAGVFAWVLVGEVFTWVKLAGAGVTLLGVALAQYAGRPQLGG